MHGYKNVKNWLNLCYFRLQTTRHFILLFHSLQTDMANILHAWIVNLFVI